MEKSDFCVYTEGGANTLPDTECWQLQLIFCLGVDIGFEQSSYYVSEDAEQIDVCATIQHAVEMESSRDFTVEFRTSSGSTCVLI